jgi:hypothetical protein
MLFCRVPCILPVNLLLVKCISSAFPPARECKSGTVGRAPTVLDERHPRCHGCGWREERCSGPRRGVSPRIGVVAMRCRRTSDRPALPPAHLRLRRLQPVPDGRADQPSRPACLARRAQEGARVGPCQHQLHRRRVCQPKPRLDAGGVHPATGTASGLRCRPPSPAAVPHCHPCHSHGPGRPA